MIKAFFRVLKRKLHPNHNLFTLIISVIFGLLPILMFFEFLEDDENEVAKGLAASTIIFSFAMFLHLAILAIINDYQYFLYTYWGLGISGIVLNFINWFRLAIWRDFMGEVKNESETSED